MEKVRITRSGFKAKLLHPVTGQETSRPKLNIDTMIEKATSNDPSTTTPHAALIKVRAVQEAQLSAHGPSGPPTPSRQITEGSAAGSATLASFSHILGGEEGPPVIAVATASSSSTR